MKFKIPKISQQNKILLCSFLFLMLVYMLFGMKSEKPVTKYNPVYADTLIPKGFVLIPIELANADSVSALMDQFGVVDLFTGTLTARGNKKIAAKVKILRAPLNPNQYAVLVPETLSQTIMNASGPFWAIVQNRDAKQEDIKEKVNHTVRIEYHQTGADL
ncbi:MAG: hypothetical protein H7256_01725 [Bdellovibrio sp.]|nr:hypothetical protein [Bdellovibrio sp.]